MVVYLLGVIGADRRLEFGNIGPANRYGEKSEVVTIPYGKIAMVVCKLDDWQIRQNDKEDLLAKLIEHQKVLEQVMQKQFILPVKFGTVVQDEHDVVDIMSRYRVQLENAVDEMSPFIEVDVIAVWDVQKMLKQIADEDDEIRKMKEMIEALPPDKRQGRDLMAIGMRLEEKLEEIRSKTEKIILEHLGRISEDRAEHERLEDKMVINSSFLIKKSREDEFFNAMNELDRKLNEALQFKCLSPLPPHSFRTVIVEKIDVDTLMEAVELFGVTAKTTFEEIKEKNRKMTMKHHPDKSKGDGALFEKINRSYKTLSNLAQSVSTQPFEDLDVKRCFRVEIRKEEKSLL